MEGFSGNLVSRKFHPIDESHMGIPAARGRAGSAQMHGIVIHAALKGALPAAYGDVFA